jgi:hypothetical protein
MVIICRELANAGYCDNCIMDIEDTYKELISCDSNQPMIFYAIETDKII